MTKVHLLKHKYRATNVLNSLKKNQDINVFARLKKKLKATSTLLHFHLQHDFLAQSPYLTSAKTSPKSPDRSCSEFDRICKQRPQTSAVYLLADPCSGMLKKQYKMIWDTNF